MTRVASSANAPLNGRSRRLHDEQKYWRYVSDNHYFVAAYQ
jgi:hypothetical protein